MYTYKFWSLSSEAVKNFPNIASTFDYPEALILGPIMHGYTSISNKSDYRLQYRTSFFGNASGEPLNAYVARKTLPSCHSYIISQGPAFMGKITVSDKLVREYRTTGPSYYFKEYERTTTLSWSSSVVNDVRRMATDFADKIYANYKYILEKAFNSTIAKVHDASYGSVSIYSKGLSAYNYNNTKGGEFSFAANGFQALSTIQIYGFALALQRYMQEKGTGYSLHNVSPYTGLRFEIKRSLRSW